MLVPCPRELMYVALPPLKSDPKVPHVANLQLQHSNQLSHIHTYMHTCTYIHTYIQTYIFYKDPYGPG